MSQEIKLDNIPDELKKCDQWIIWKYVEKKGKEIKLPLSTKTGKAVDAHNGDHWVSVDEALEAVGRHDASGIGFVFTENDHFGGIDLDKCIVENKITNEKAKKILKLARSYFEISPSQTGIKIFLMTTKKTLPDGKQGHKVGNYEIYLGRRFFTVTGQGKGRIRYIDDDTLDEIFSLILGDDEIITKVQGDPRGERLWEGDANAYESESEADMALCGIIARYTKDRDQLDRVFRKSGLYRDKWDENRGGQTYGEMTASKAISNSKLYNKVEPRKLPEVNSIQVAEGELERRAKKVLESYYKPIRLNPDPLPARVKSYLRLLSADTAADTSLLMAGILSCASAFMKKKIAMPKVQVGQEGYFQQLHPNLWILGIADSGTFKTTAINHGTELAASHDAEIRNRIKNDGTEGLQKELLLFPNISTMDGLLEDLGKNESGLLRCYELGTWFDSFGKSYNAGLQDLFMELYDVPDVYIKTTKTSGTLEIHEPYISIYAATTPSWMNEKMTTKQVGTGFLARFLIFYPPNAKQVPKALPSAQQQNLDWKDKEEVYDILKRIRQTNTRKYILLSADATSRFTKHHESIYDGFHDLSDKSQDIITPFIKRWSPYLLKLGMIMQMFIDAESDTISVEAIDAGKEILDYAIHSTKVLLEKEIGESDHQRKQRIILEYIAKYEGKVKWRKLLQSKKLDGGHKDYMYVVESLASAGLVDIIKNDKMSEWEIILTEG